MNENENNRNENADVRRIRVIRYEAGEKKSRTGTQKNKKERFSGYRKTAPLRKAAGRRGWKQIIEELHIGGIIGTGRQLPFFICLLQRSGLAAVHRKHSAVIHETGRIRHIPDMLHVDKFRICSMLTRIPLFMIRKRGSSCSCPAADLKVMRKRRSFPLETESII